MKHLKKLASVLLALVMALALMAPAFAATSTVKIPSVTTPGGETANTTGHTYDLYQIFTGIPNGDSFTNIAWGANVADQAKFIQALKAITGTTAFDNLTDNSEADTVAEAIETYTGGRDYGDEAKAVQNAILGEGILTAAAYGGKQLGGDTATGDFPMGWYLVRDTYRENAAASPVYNHTLLRVNSTVIEIKQKVDKTPEFKKEVQTYTIDGNSGTWTDQAAYPVPNEDGQPVNFRLTATLPSSYDPTNSDAYRLIFHDNLEDGKFRTVDTTTVTVTVKYKVNNVEKEETLDVGSDYSIVTGTTDIKDDCDFEIRIANLKDVMVGDPAARIPTGASIVVEYTAILLQTADLGGDGNVNSAKLSFGVDGETTPVDIPVFTFELDINKFDGTANTKTALADAEFTLKRYEPGNGDDVTTGEGESAVTAKGDWLTIGTLAGTGADENKFEFKDLVPGKYELTETVTPDGFNTMQPVYFELSYKTVKEGGKLMVTEVTTTQMTFDDTKDGDSKWSVATGDNTFTTTNLTSTATGGAASVIGATADINNYQGAILPETGGIGTTIFYIVGGVLVVGAVVLLITKRRAGADEE